MKGSAPGHRGELPEAFASRGLLPFERRLAVNAYRRLTDKLSITRPGLTEENYRLAMNAAYSVAAAIWMVLWVPLVIGAALSFTINHTLTVVFAVAAGFPAAVSFFRMFQAIRFYSGPRKP